METSGDKQHSTYEIWLNGLALYLDMYEKGLKKQANKYITSFIDEFEHSVPKEDLRKILWRFCQEICDEDKHSQLLSRGNGSLPYTVGKVVWNYLKNQCESETMPHMRWAFQLFGKYYNPFDPQLKLNMFKVLKKAYEHKDCDQKTVDLYFNEILEQLYWGAHKLYQCFYEYEESGYEKDFYQLCEKAGIKYKSIPAYYFQ